MSTTETTDLSLLIRAGSLAAPMEIIEERTVGPSLGQENIEKGFNATMWGFIVIVVFMSLYYTLFGVISSIALAVNLLFLVALLSLLQATLTLPGIAAIALTLGMAIDANVLINERIREELRSGAIAAGGDRRRLRARLGHDSRLQRHHADRGPRAAHLRLGAGARLRGGALPRHPDLDLLLGGGVARDRQPRLRPPPQGGAAADRRHRLEIELRWNSSRSAASSRSCGMRSSSTSSRWSPSSPRSASSPPRACNFSIEFTGGTLIEVNYKQAADVDAIREPLEKAGFKGEVQNFGSSRDVLIRLPLEKDQSSADLSQKVLQVLKAQDATAEVRRVEFVGPQVGDELAEYGALALLVTAVGIVLYLWMRFEWRFGLSAIIANLHDVVIILGFFALFQWEFSLPVLAAVLAVLGYSVNESVVVFDRVRENFRKMRKASTAEVIDSAITGVISRTIITHRCTQMMVTTMLIFGGPALHYFALALTIGICFGIYSSVLVASPLVMWLGATREQFIVPPKKKAGGRRARRRRRLAFGYFRICTRFE